jgi:DNA (cytosine-5)-methyltransferase 1
MILIEDIGVVDLFCGIGGLAYGLKQEGFDILAGVDIDESCKYAFEANNESKFISKSISDISRKEISNLYMGKKIKVLVGCAPCQPFSSYTFKDKDKANNKWLLLYEFARLIRETKPEIVSMENVAQLVNFKKAPVFEDFLKELEALGYHTHYEIVNCPDYGIPQNRKRLVLLASKFGKINLIPKTHNKKNYVTVRDTIESLPKISDGDKDKHDFLHCSRKLSPTNKKRIQATPYGGSWLDWPDELKLECHKKESGKSYSSVYGRMKWDEPSPTITTHCIGFGNGRFGHPVQDRGISIREAALLQTFPPSYKFAKDENDFSIVKISKQLGNAVPVKLGEVIAKSIKIHIKKYE